MYRIAILGTENSHAMTFAKYINLPGADGKRPFPDMEVVGVYGDEASAGAILKEAGVKHAAKSPEEFLGKVDAVMVTARWGSRHAPYAMPYAKAGIPLFIDKPFTSDSAEAKEFIALLKQKNVMVTGGSACKYSPTLFEMKKAFLEDSAAGTFITGTLNFNVIPDSEYDGLFFYASHLIEMAFAVFGEEVKTVAAFRKNDSITAIFGYEKFDVTLLFTAGAWNCAGTLYGPKEIKHYPLDMATVFNEEVRVFHDMLVTRKMSQTYESLVLPVTLIEVLARAVKTGALVTV